MIGSSHIKVILALWEAATFFIPNLSRSWRDYPGRKKAVYEWKYFHQLSHESFDGFFAATQKTSEWLSFEAIHIFWGG